jgi:excisionase family DNA binding protein
MATAAQQSENRQTGGMDDLHQLLHANEHLMLAVPGREGIVLPESVIQVLRQVIGYMHQGKGVAITPMNRNLTTQAAANLLGVSRPFVVELLNKKEIPFHLVGTHRRIYLEDLLRYRSRRDKGRRDILNQMAHEAIEEGDYDRLYATHDRE